MKIEEYIEKYLQDRLPHARQVEKFSVKLLNALEEKYHIEKREKLLRYGALLHDIGMSEGEGAHNKTGANIIAQHAIEDLDEEENLIVACLVRYHRGSAPKSTHRKFAKLDKNSQTLIKQYSSIIRLADALDWKHENFVQDFDLEFDNFKAFLTLNLNSNIINIITRTGFLKFFRKKKEFFEKVFEVALSIKTK